MTKTILTGLKTNDILHIGNYFGGIAPMVQTQAELRSGDRLMMFIPDLHSFTTPIDHSLFYQSILNTVKMFLAGGINPEQPATMLYRQSRIAAHAEMAWILNCFTYFGEASRMTAFKEKAARLNQETVTVGLFAYPILMAADILLYGADYIPVGEDQKQHLELTRKLAERMNNKFGANLLVVPKTWEEQLKFAGQDNPLRIRSLLHPEQKMSKSIADPKGTISLLDEPQEAFDKVMSATTDSVGVIKLDFEYQPGIGNLLQLLALLSNKPLKEVAIQWEGNTSYGDLKSQVAPLVRDFLIDFQSKYQTITDQRVEEILDGGEVRAREIAEATLAKVKLAIGLERQ